MGNIIHHKGILLDEHDLEGAPHACLETLAATLHDHLLDAFEPEGDLDSGCPELELYGLASERFGATHLYGDPRWFAHKLNWLKADGDVRSALLREIRHLDLPDPDAVLREDAAALRALEPSLQRTICARVATGDYAAAAHLLSTLRDLQTGLPGLEPEGAFDWDGHEAIFDFRTTRRGSGTRLLAEIGFNWGQ